MLPPRHHPRHLSELGCRTYWARCSSILWMHHRGFTVARSPLLSNLRPMPRWYSQVRNRRCARQGAPISPRRRS